jgi:hypothetical protein
MKQWERKEDISVPLMSTGKLNITPVIHSYVNGATTDSVIK